MASRKYGYNCEFSSIEEHLYHTIDNMSDENDTKLIESLLAQGANPTKLASNGRTTIGHTASLGFSQILKLLLQSCDEPCKITRNCRVSESSSSFVDDEDENEGSEPKKLKPLQNQQLEMERTPDGMENLQWEEEICENGNGPAASINASEDEWSKLYIYYAQMIEKTGDILANTIKSKDPHCLDFYHYAPLHYAALVGSVACAELLLEYNSPVDVSSNNGLTPLYLAIKHPNVVQLLLKHKANPNRQTYHCLETPLHTAAQYGDPQTIGFLLDAGADINVGNTYNMTPLILAIADKSDLNAYILIDRGAKLNVQDEEGFTPLYYAVINNNTFIAEHLLMKGARLFVSHYLMHYCIRKDFEDMIHILVNFGDNINIRDITGWTPLLMSIRKRNISLITYFLSAGAFINRDDDLSKELHVAIEYCQSCEQFYAISRILLLNGIDINYFNYWRESPLHHSILLEKYHMAEFLVKEGACVNDCGAILKLIRLTNNVNLLKLLVNAGLQLNHNRILPPRQKNAASQSTATDPDNNLEDYLELSMKNPLSLQQLARISIRNQIKCYTRPLNSPQLNTDNLDGSILKYKLSQLNLPKVIQSYLYEFPDVPFIDNNNQCNCLNSYNMLFTERGLNED